MPVIPFNCVYKKALVLVQKAIRAGVAIMVAVGAPSSLAVSLAREFGMTLLGFAKEQSFNIYSTPERILIGKHS